MDFWGAMRLVRRRWYVVVPALLASIGIAYLVFASIPTRFQSTGAIVLTTPSTGGRVTNNPDEGVKINPLLAFDGSLTTTAQILVQILGDPQTHKSLGAGAGSSQNYVANTGDNSSPFLFVVADSDTAAGAEALVTKVLDHARAELAARQTELKAPESTFISAQVLVKPTAAEAQIGGKIRFAGAAMVLGLIMTAASTFGSESVMLALRRRRLSASEVESSDIESGSTPEPATRTRAIPETGPPPKPAVASPRQTANVGIRQPPGAPYPLRMSPVPQGRTADQAANGRAAGGQAAGGRTTNGQHTNGGQPRGSGRTAPTWPTGEETVRAAPVAPPAKPVSQDTGNRQANGRTGRQPSDQADHPAPRPRGTH